MKHKKFITLQLLFITLFLSALFTYCKPDEPMQPAGDWQTIYQDSTVRMARIRFLDNNTGFILAVNTIAIDTLRGRQFVFKTTDAGKTWVKYACLFPTYNDGARMMTPLNENTLIAGGYYLYISKDNGLNWNIINPDYTGLNIFDIYMKDSLNWILADGNAVSLTTDAGKTYKKVFTTDNPVPFGHLAFPSNTVGYACGGANDDYYRGGVIAKTSDGGLNWIALHPEPWHSNYQSFPDANAIQFITELTGYIFTVNGEIYKTIDGGNNWALITKMNFLYLGYFVNENVGYCASKNIFETDNGGKKWNSGYTSTEDDFIIDMLFLKSGNGYAITYNSKIIKKSSNK